MQSESKNVTLDEKGMRKSTVVLRNAYVYVRQVIVPLLIPNIIHHLSLYRNNNSYSSSLSECALWTRRKGLWKEKKKEKKRKKEVNGGDDHERSSMVFPEISSRLPPCVLVFCGKSILNENIGV